MPTPLPNSPSVMSDSSGRKKIGALVVVGFLSVCILLPTSRSVQAQSPPGQGAESSVQIPAPRPGAAHNSRSARPHRPPPSIPGATLPPAARSPTPSSGRNSSRSSTVPQGNANSSVPEMPDDPAQAPVDGGIGWLAAAGAAYAANRLRKEATSDDND